MMDGKCSKEQVKGSVLFSFLVIQKGNMICSAEEVISRETLHVVIGIFSREIQGAPFDTTLIGFVLLFGANVQSDLKDPGLLRS
jgi:hypothetical protein